MTNQTHNGPPRDAAKKRREYLFANTYLATSTALLLLLAILSFAVCGAMVLRMILWRENCCLSLVLSGVGCLGASWMMRKSARRMDTLPYVPPVAEQIADLPAEDILVRGSNQPAAASGELLRAAREGAEAEAEELLRADQARRNST